MTDQPVFDWTYLQLSLPEAEHHAWFQLSSLDKKHFSVCSASTRKVYEKKLQKLLDEHAAEPAAPTDVTTLPKADSNQNGNTNSDHYSDKEDGERWSLPL